MKMMRLSGFTAAAVICLGMTQHDLAGADCLAHRVQSSENVVSLPDSTGSGDETTFTRVAGFSAAAGSPLAVSPRAALADEGSGALFDESGPALLPCGPTTGEICCTEHHGQSCCCAPFAGCFCVPN